jgi:single-strand DNA-binding protein
VKGSEVAIEGKLVSRVYTANDGQKKFITEVVANELLLLTRKAS